MEPQKQKRGVGLGGRYTSYVTPTLYDSLLSIQARLQEGKITRVSMVDTLGEVVQYWLQKHPRKEK